MTVSETWATGEFIPEELVWYCIILFFADNLRFQAQRGKSWRTEAIISHRTSLSYKGIFTFIIDPIACSSKLKSVLWQHGERYHMKRIADKACLLLFAPKEIEILVAVS